MNILSKDSILTAQDLKREVVEVPEWGEGAAVLVGELSAAGRLKFAESIKEEGNRDKTYIALAVTHFIINEDGGRMFDDDSADALAGKSLQVLKRIFDKAQALNLVEDAAMSDTAKK